MENDEIVHGREDVVGLATIMDDGARKVGGRAKGFEHYDVAFGWLAPQHQKLRPEWLIVTETVGDVSTL